MRGWGVMNQPTPTPTGGAVIKGQVPLGEVVFPLINLGTRLLGEIVVPYDNEAEGRDLWATRNNVGFRKGRGVECLGNCSNHTVSERRTRGNKGG